MHREGICAAGVWLIDVIKQIDAFPAPDGLALIGEVVRSNGGGAFNLAIDLAKLGATFPISGIGLIGADREGDAVLERCRSAGIDTALLTRTRDYPTAFTDVMTEQAAGRRTFFYAPGANAQLKLSHFDKLEEQTARIFFLGYPGLLPGLDLCDSEECSGFERLLNRASRHGMTTAVDCVSSPFASWNLIRKALPEIDILFLNAWEAGRLLDHSSDGTRETTAAALSQNATQLLKEGVRKIVIIHTKNGAIAVTQAGEVTIRGAVRVPPESVRGTCGAGDALAAGFLFGIHQGMQIPDALELGTCAAATCVTHLTASEGILPVTAALAYGRELGYLDF